MVLTKAEARRQARALRAALPAGWQARTGAAMARRLCELPQWRQAQAVLGFASLPDEPDTFPILLCALAQGKRLYLPRVQGKGRMLAVPVDGEAALRALMPGALGLREPQGPGLGPRALGPGTLTLVPCLAVGRDGVRLGRGGGYYDRFLPGCSGPRLLLCPAALVLDALPCDGWDIPFPADQILTEAGLLDAAPPAGPPYGALRNDQERR